MIAPRECGKKLEAYRRWGVPHIWLHDPEARRFFVFDGEIREVASFHLPEFGIEIKPEDIEDIDE